MEINLWKEKISDFYEEKFPNQDWSIQDRILGIISQCSDLAERVQYDQKLRKVNKQHNTKELLVASILLDVFVLCGKLKIDIDKGLDDALSSFNKVER